MAAALGGARAASAQRGSIRHGISGALASSAAAAEKISSLPRIASAASHDGIWRWPLRRHHLARSAGETLPARGMARGALII